MRIDLKSEKDYLFIAIEDGSRSIAMRKDTYDESVFVTDGGVEHSVVVTDDGVWAQGDQAVVQEALRMQGALGGAVGYDGWGPETVVSATDSRVEVAVSGVRLGVDVDEPTGFDHLVEAIARLRGQL